MHTYIYIYIYTHVYIYIYMYTHIIESERYMYILSLRGVALRVAVGEALDVELQS